MSVQLQSPTVESADSMRRSASRFATIAKRRQRSSVRFSGADLLAQQGSRRVSHSPDGSGSATPPDIDDRLPAGRRSLAGVVAMATGKRIPGQSDAAEGARTETRNFAIDLLQRISGGDSAPHTPPEQLAETFRQFAHEKRSASITHPIRRGAELYLLADEFVELVVVQLLGRRTRLVRRRSDALRLQTRGLPGLTLASPRRGGDDDRGIAGSAALQRSVLNLFHAVDLGATGRVTWDALLSFLIDATMQGRIGGAASDIHQFNITRAYCPSDFGLMGRMQYIPKIGKLLVQHETQGVRLVGCQCMGAEDKGDIIPVPGKTLCATYVDCLRMVATSSADLWIRLHEQKSGKVRAVARCDESQVSIAWSERWVKLFTAGRSGYVSQWIFRFFRMNSHGEELEVPPDLEAAENPNIQMRMELHAKSQPHRSPVRAVLFLPLDGSFVSASLDPGLVIQDPLRFEPKTQGVVTRFDGFRSGLLSAAFSRDYGLVLSAGYQREVMAWPVSSGRQPPLILLDKQHPHVHPIIALHAVQGSAQVHSLDQSGLLKVWDIRSFGCVQSITCNDPSELQRVGITHSQLSVDGGLTGTEHQSMVYLPTERRIIVNTRRRFVAADYCHQVDSRQESAKSTADARPIAAVCYMADSQLLLTASGNRVRVWDLVRGLLSTSYEELLPDNDDEVSAMACDAAERRFFIGTRNGKIAAHTTASGAPVARHNLCLGEEVQLLRWMALRSGYHYLFCVGWAGSSFSLALSPDKANSPIVTLSNSWFGTCVSESKCIGVSPGLLLCAIGLGSERFSLWRFDDSGGHDDLTVIAVCPTLQLFGNRAMSIKSPVSATAPAEDGMAAILQAGGASDVTCVHFLEGTQLLFVASAKGTLQLWNLTSRNPTSQEARVVAEWQADSRHLHSSHAVLPAVGSATFTLQREILYTGDERGALCAYPIGCVLRQEDPPDPPDSPKGLTCLVKGRKVSTFDNHISEPGPWELFAIRPAVQAHESGFKSLFSTERPYALIVSSGGLDRRVRMWTPLLEPIGYLDPYVVGGTYHISSSLLARLDEPMMGALEEAESLAHRPETISGSEYLRCPLSGRAQRFGVRRGPSFRRGYRGSILSSASSPVSRGLARPSFSNLPRIGSMSGASASGRDAAEEETDEGSPARRHAALLAATGANSALAQQSPREPRPLGTATLLAQAQQEEIGALASSKERYLLAKKAGARARIRNLDRADHAVVLDLETAVDKWDRLDKAIQEVTGGGDGDGPPMSMYEFFVSSCQKSASQLDTHARTRRADRIARDRRRRQQEANRQARMHRDRLREQAAAMWADADLLRDAAQAGTPPARKRMQPPPESPRSPSPPRAAPPSPEHNPFLASLAQPPERPLSRAASEGRRPSAGRLAPAGARPRPASQAAPRPRAPAKSPSASPPSSPVSSAEGDEVVDLSRSIKLARRAAGKSADEARVGGVTLRWRRDSRSGALLAQPARLATFPLRKSRVLREKREPPPAPESGRLRPWLPS